MAFINDYYNPKAADRRERDRNLYVGFLEVAGPLGVKPKLPESHTRLITATPNGRAWDAPAREVLRSFARRAYRRPPTEAEIERLISLVKMGQKNGETFEQSYLAQEDLLMQFIADAFDGKPPTIDWTLAPVEPTD